MNASYWLKLKIARRSEKKDRYYMHPFQRHRNKKFFKRYPFWEVHEWTYKPMKPRYKYSWLDRFPRGWRKALAKSLSEDLREACIKEGCLDTILVVDLKPKYGELRIEMDRYYDEVDKVLRAYEHISGYVCNCCGKLDVPMINMGGWIDPICEDCYNKHINYNKPYKECSDGDTINIIPSYYMIKKYKDGKCTEEKIDISKYVERVRRDNNDILG